MHRLGHIFKHNEIVYALSSPTKSAERFAARFAAKEAFYKAFSQMAPKSEKSFFVICRLVEVVRKQYGSTQLSIDWKALFSGSNTSIKIHLSLSHNRTTATALVIIEK